MNPEIVSIHREEYLREDGMLFVRTDGILETMVKAPLIMVGLIVAVIVMPIQTSFGSTRTLELTIYSDGSTHISHQIDIDPLNPDFETTLFGPSIDNFVVVGETGFLLSSEISGNVVSIDTFGSSSITIDYDTHDLVSKEGRVWTFSFNSPSDYTLLMPENSVIVGMNALPNNMELIDEQTRLELSSGPAEINYILGVSTIPSNNTTTETPFDYMPVAIIAGPIIAAITGITLILKKRQSKPLPQTIQNEAIVDKKENKTIDTETIFNLRPEMRDDDKEIIKFISENGGQVFESDLRKKFLQPRTTMWRAVKRLERLGVVEIIKKDLQNMVKLKEELEEEE
ncbi:MAG: MarR family transcriptional regulator [Nitrosarchaeum sp.]|nr:MarR family transcriptional regulator [Nitrosarchaeum sp.]